MSTTSATGLPDPVVAATESTRPHSAVPSATRAAKTARTVSGSESTSPPIHFRTRGGYKRCLQGITCRNRGSAYDAADIVVTAQCEHEIQETLPDQSQLLALGKPDYPRTLEIGSLEDESSIPSEPLYKVLSQ